MKYCVLLLILLASGAQARTWCDLYITVVNPSYTNTLKLNHYKWGYKSKLGVNYGLGPQTGSTQHITTRSSYSYPIERIWDEEGNCSTYNTKVRLNYQCQGSSEVKTPTTGWYRRDNDKIKYTFFIGDCSREFGPAENYVQVLHNG